MSNPSNTDLVESWRPFFEVEYARDRRNAQKQRFDEYWQWVKTYLLVGGSGYAGWLEQRAALMAGLRDEATRACIGALFEETGKRVAAEWSKDSSCRRVYSTFFQGRPNLVEWGRALQAAERRDRGDGAAIEAALRAIQADLERALKR
jgi:hypothetical protein